MGIAIGQVPEPKTVKHRVHLDVLARSVQDVLDLGATVAPGYPDTDKWTVLLDPEGGELCVFERDEVPSYRSYELVVDAVDPAADHGVVGRGLRRPGPQRGRSPGAGSPTCPACPSRRWSSSRSRSRRR